jgi:hypothetical protein
MNLNVGKLLSLGLSWSKKLSKIPLTLGNDIIRVGSTFCLDAWHHAGGAGIFMLMQKNSSWRVKCHPIITGIFTRSIR